MHQAAHLNLVGGRLIKKLCVMGMSVDELFPLGGTRFHGHNSSKEGDSTFKPYSFRQKATDWPTIVFESGVSQSLPHLRFDARWWLENSGGDVKIAIIISIEPVQSSLQIEKWELAPMAEGRPSTRANHPIPTKTQEITITPNAVTGAPLDLEFEKVFLRPAVPPERDIRFTGQDLSDWAAFFWKALGR
jgi:hypothetical protein